MITADKFEAANLPIVIRNEAILSESPTLATARQLGDLNRAPVLRVVGSMDNQNDRSREAAASGHKVASEQTQQLQRLADAQA